MTLSVNHTHDQASAAPRRCFLLGRARSGTTVFRRMVNSHPAVGALSEIFNADARHNYFEYLAKQYKKNPALCFPQHSIPLYHGYLDAQCARMAKKQVVVFDVKYECMHVVYKPWHAALDVAAPLQEIRAHGWLVMHVTRRNHLRRMISNARAVASGTYHVASGKARAQGAPIRLNVADLLGKFAAFDAAYDRTEAYFAGYPHYFHVDYDDMFVTTGDTTAFDPALLQRTADFLGIPNTFDGMPREGKATPQPVQEAISNYDEVEAILRGTPYAHLLREAYVDHA